MNAVGIIAEYDPFHSGHAWQIEKARKMGAQAVVVSMSADLVQRGSAALLPPWVRAKAAVLCGADLVLELPNPCACLSAEGFANAGVAQLSALPAVDTLLFGAEQANLALLMDVASVLLDRRFDKLLTRELAKGMPFAAARAAAAGEILPASKELLSLPNNNLGIEYCKAILRQNSGLVPVALQREGANHGENMPGKNGFASASYLRECWNKSGVNAIQNYVPPKAADLYRAEEKQAIDRRLWDIAVLSRLRGMHPEQIAKTRGTAEGLEYLLANSVKTAGSLEELYAQMKSKRYAHARLRRYVLDAALGYTENLPKTSPYLHVLAATQKGFELLKGAKLPADTSLARLERCNQNCRIMAAAHTQAADLAALCRIETQQSGQSYTRPPLIQK